MLVGRKRFLPVSAGAPATSCGRCQSCPQRSRPLALSCSFRGLVPVSGGICFAWVPRYRSCNAPLRRYRVCSVCHDSDRWSRLPRTGEIAVSKDHIFRSTLALTDHAANQRSRSVSRLRPANRCTITKLGRGARPGTRGTSGSGGMPCHFTRSRSVCHYSWSSNRHGTFSMGIKRECALAWGGRTGRCASGSGAGPLSNRARRSSFAMRSARWYSSRSKTNSAHSSAEVILHLAVPQVGDDIRQHMPSPEEELCRPTHQTHGESSQWRQSNGLEDDQQEWTCDHGRRSLHTNAG